MAAGDSTASPNPTPMRAAKSCPKLCDRPQARVLQLQTNTPMKMRLRREVLVGEQAQGNTGDAVHDRERRAQQQAHLRIADSQLAADGVHQQAQDLPVGVRQDRS